MYVALSFALHSIYYPSRPFLSLNIAQIRASSTQIVLEWKAKTTTHTQYLGVTAACNLVNIVSPFAGKPPYFAVQSVCRSIGGLRIGDCKSMLTNPSWKLTSQSWWWWINWGRPHPHVLPGSDVERRISVVLLPKAI